MVQPTPGLLELPNPWEQGLVGEACLAPALSGVLDTNDRSSAKVATD